MIYHLARFLIPHNFLRSLIKHYTEKGKRVCLSVCGKRGKFSGVCVFALAGNCTFFDATEGGIESRLKEGEWKKKVKSHP